MNNKGLSIIYKYNDYELADVLEIFLLKYKLREIFSNPLVINTNNKGNYIYKNQFKEKIKEIFSLGFLNFEIKNNLAEQKKNALYMSKEIQKTDMLSALRKAYLKDSIKLCNFDCDDINLDSQNIFSPLLYDMGEYAEICNTRKKTIDVFKNSNISSRISENGKYDIENSKYIFTYFTDFSEYSTPIKNLANLLSMDILNVLQVSEYVRPLSEYLYQINPNYTNILDLLNSIYHSQMVFTNNKTILFVALAMNKKVFGFSKKDDFTKSKEDQEQIIEILAKLNLLETYDLAINSIITTAVQDYTFDYSNYINFSKKNIFNLANVIRFEIEKKEKERIEREKEEELERKLSEGELPDNIIRMTREDKK